MKNIDLGAIKVPLDEYASQGNAILGIRDSGKSYTATAIAERLMDSGIPIIAFDPIGIWRYLRVPGAGKGYEDVAAFYEAMCGRDADDTLDSLRRTFDDADEWRNDGAALKLELYCAVFSVWKVSAAELEMPSASVYCGTCNRDMPSGVYCGRCGRKIASDAPADSRTLGG